MQSYLQYRNFRSNLQKQIDRYGLERVASATSHPPLSRAASLSRFLQPDGTLPFDSPLRDAAVEEKETEDDGGVLAPAPISQIPTPTAEDIEADAANRNAEHRDSAYDFATGRHEPHGAQSEPQSRRVSYRNGGDDLSGSTNFHSDSGSDAGKDATTASDVGSSLQETGTRLGRFLSGISVRSRAHKEKKGLSEHYFVVDYQGPTDPLNPHNWSTGRRLFYTVLVAKIGLIVGVASSIDSAAAAQFIDEFGVSEAVEATTTGMYLIGFGCGAFFAAPFSETVGRNPVYLVTGILYMIFVMASGLSLNIGAQLIFRFFAGFFGSTPLTCAGGSLSDMWTPTERTLMFPVFAMSAFIGPVIGPIIGGWIGQSYLSPRWTDWITLIWSGAIFAACFIWLPETYQPVLLKWKAEHLRKITGDARYMSALEVDEVKFTDRLLRNLYRPWLMLFLEPIVMLFTLYLTVVYIVLFTFLTGFEFTFEETYGISQGLTFTCFTGLAVGFLLVGPFVPLVYRSYVRKLKKAHEEGKTKLAPEERLIYAMMGCPWMTIGIFWMGWTAYPSVSIWSPIVACVPIGFGILGIFLTTYQYLVDAFEAYAASALVGITFVRYVVAGGMLPVSIPFYRNLGVHWTLTILGVISAIMVPVPYLFYIFGEKTRSKSRYAVGAAVRKA